MRSIRDILDEWRAASRDLAEREPEDPVRYDMERRVDALRTEYLAAFDRRQAGDGGVVHRGEDLPAVSDELLAAVGELRGLLARREETAAAGRARLAPEIDRTSAKILRLAQLQRRMGESVPEQNSTIDALDDGPPASAVADHARPEGGRSRGTDALLRAARELRELEREKRSTNISSERFEQLAAEVEERARRVFRLTELDDGEDADDAAYASGTSGPADDEVRQRG